MIITHPAELYLVRIGGRGDYAIAHAHDDAAPGLGNVCGAHLAEAHWALEDAEASRLRRKVLCGRCAAQLRAHFLTSQEVGVR